MSVKVAVRVRPFNQRQKFLGCLNCIQMKQKTTILINPRDRSQKEHQFTFDYSFWSHDGFEQLENGYLYPIDDRFIDQKRIFQELGEEIIRNAWNGFNCCLFAYGQTGAGKSYSMIGYETNRGIVPMACERIFQGISKKRVRGKKEFQLTISMLQIYNEKVQDLFVHTSKRPPNGLRIRQNKRVGVYVQGITKYQVNSYDQIQRKMEEGARNRSLASTLMNAYSSRAHTIVIIEFIQKQFITEQKMNKKQSTLNLVDLAGSERVAKTGISDKDRLKQASQINKSLHTLGRVIEHLAEIAAGKKNSQNIQVPYRDSCLTRILQTALGGNSMTTMICAVSPANDNYEETLSTLRYADQTKKIKNKPIINQSAVDKIIRELRQENQRLKEMLRIAKLKGVNIEQMMGSVGQGGGYDEEMNEQDLLANIQAVRASIRKNMQSFAINTENMDEQGSGDDGMYIKQFIDLPDPNDFYSGEDLSFDNPFPNTSNFSSSPTSTHDMSVTTIGNKKTNVYITNLSQDTLLSFKIKYSCEDRDLFIGNKNLKDGKDYRQRLILCGLGIEDRHARIFQIQKDVSTRDPQNSGNQIVGKQKCYFIETLCDAAGDYTLVNGRPLYFNKNQSANITGMKYDQIKKRKGLRELFHNDRLIFGTNSIFLFKNLNQKQKNEKNKKQAAEEKAKKASISSEIGIGTGVDGFGSGKHPQSGANTREGKKNQMGIEAQLPYCIQGQKAKSDVRKSILLLDDDDQNDQSMLLDWNEGEENDDGIISNLKKIKSQGAMQTTHNQGNLPSRKLTSQIEMMTDFNDPLSNISKNNNSSDQDIDEHLLDYEFAINQRQNNLLDLETSNISSMSNSYLHSPNSYNRNKNQEANNALMQEKLAQIELQFQELIKQNEKKLKEKEQKFREELLRIERQRQSQKSKILAELKEKQTNMMKISAQKEQIEKLKEELMRQKDEILILIDEETKSKEAQQRQMEEKIKMYEEEVEKGKKKEIEYIDRHHFHYDYNIVENTMTTGAGGNTGGNREYFDKEEENTTMMTNEYHNNSSNNTTNTFYNTNNSHEVGAKNPTSSQITMAMTKNTSFNTEQKVYETQEESILLDDYSQHIVLDEGKKNQQQKITSQGPSRYREMRTGEVDGEGKKDFVEKQRSGQAFNQRKKSLNLTDILYDTGYSPSNNPNVSKNKNPNPNSYFFSDEANMLPTGSLEEENLLLNITTGQGLGSYLPLVPKVRKSRKDSTNSAGSQGYGDATLNYSILSDEDSGKNQRNSMKFPTEASINKKKQEELNNKILLLEEKLKNLEESKQKNQQSIQNIRKSFAIDFGGDNVIDSEKFYSKSSIGHQNSEEENEIALELSMIQSNRMSVNFCEEDQEEPFRKMQMQQKVKSSMIQAQNENIINERNLQVRKRKREAEEIKQIFVKKEKRELHKQLLELIPMLEKFNLWGREMGRNLEGKIHIQYRNFTNYEIVEALKSDRNFSKVSIMVKIVNYQEGRSYKWSIQIFRNRYEIIQNLFERFLENPGSDLFSDKSKDPFWEPRDFQSYAVAYLTLEPLSYNMSFQGQICFVEKGQIVAHLCVSLQPAIDRKSKKLRAKLHESEHLQNQIQDPRELLQNDIVFTISIDHFEPTEHLPVHKIQKYYISYELLEDSYKTSTFKTQQMAISKRQINYMFKHSFRNITQHTLAYIADCPLRFILNLNFEYDDDLSHMTSSFIASTSMCDSVLNTSNLSDGSKKSQSLVGSVLNQSSSASSASPSGFGKKKPAVIMENTEILSKLEKDYNSQKKRAQQEKALRRAQREMQEQEAKKKDKNKDSCRTN